MSMIYELTIYIAGPGTQIRDGQPSNMGHMWYGLSTSTGIYNSYGFAPSEHKETPLPVQGLNFLNDTQQYIDPAYARTFRISEAEYNALNSFGQDPFTKGFSSTYWAPTNSCIDFVWAALEYSGLNPSGHEGGMIPDGDWFGNRDDIDRYMRMPIESALQNLADPHEHWVFAGTARWPIP